MTAVILDFRKAVLLREQRQHIVEKIVNNKYDVNTYVRDGYSLRISQLNYFQDQVRKFKQHLKCGNEHFAFPSVLKNYRKGIIPVTALYEEIQKVLLTNSNDMYSMWLKNMVNNKSWTLNLIGCLEYDIKISDELIRDFNEFSDDETYQWVAATNKKFKQYKEFFILRT